MGSLILSLIGLVFCIAELVGVIIGGSEWLLLNAIGLLVFILPANLNTAL